MKSFLIFVLILVPYFAGAQEISNSSFRFGLTHGIGLYIQSDLKDLNEEVTEGLPFEVETINNFPPWSFLGGYFLVQVGPSLSVGPIYQFHTTGSRIGLKDYSGSYSFDQIISSNMVGFRTEIVLDELASSRILFQLDAGFDFATWRIKEKLAIGDEEEELEITYLALCPYIEPSFGLKWELSRVITLSVKPAFHIGLGGKYHLKNDNDITIEEKPGWYGPRISVNLDYKSVW